jgi:hypothetical protein
VAVERAVLVGPGAEVPVDPERAGARTCGNPAAAGAAGDWELVASELAPAQVEVAEQEAAEQAAPAPGAGQVG